MRRSSPSRPSLSRYDLSFGRWAVLALQASREASSGVHGSHALNADRMKEPDASMNSSPPSLPSPSFPPHSHGPFFRRFLVFCLRKLDACNERNLGQASTFPIMDTPPETKDGFQRAADQFKATISPALVNDFTKEANSLSSIKSEIKKIQDKHGMEGSLRNMTRLKRFIEAMEKLGQVIEVFVNANDFVCFIWASFNGFNLCIKSTAINRIVLTGPDEVLAWCNYTFLRRPMGRSILANELLDRQDPYRDI